MKNRYSPSKIDKMLFEKELRNYKKFFHFIFVENYKPIKTKLYLAQYQKFCDDIREEMLINRFHYFQLTEIVLLISPLNYVYNYFTDFKGDDIIINYDAAGYTGFGNNFNLIAGSLCCWALITYHKAYFSIEPEVLFGVKSIVQNDPQILFHRPFKYKNHDILKLLERNMLLLLNLCYPFCLIGSKKNH